MRNHTRVNETEYLTDALSLEAVSYIEQKSKEPFFIYLAYNAPHTPLQATEKYLKRFVHIKDEKRRTYAAMISAVDDGVGIVLEKLEEKGLTKNTIVIYRIMEGQNTMVQITVHYGAIKEIISRGAFVCRSRYNGLIK